MQFFALRKLEKKRGEGCKLKFTTTLRKVLCFYFFEIEASHNMELDRVPLPLMNFDRIRQRFGFKRIGGRYSLLVNFFACIVILRAFAFDEMVSVLDGRMLEAVDYCRR